MEENKIEKTKEYDLIYVGPIMRKDGWYKLYSDGNKHYTFEKWKK